VREHTCVDEVKTHGVLVGAVLEYEG